MFSSYTPIICHLKRLSLTALGALCLLWPPASRAAELTVAVAANFAAPMRLIAQDFERESGHRVRLAFGATGQLYAQIRHGAPFAVLLAADEEVPRKLEQDGLTVPGSRQTYAIGRLVLWSPEPGRVDAQGLVLRRPGTGKLAVANPMLAPYGAAALQVLQALGVKEAWAPHTVEGASITQAMKFVASGNAALGFVALSQVMNQGQLTPGSAWIVPTHLHSSIRQDAVLLQAGRHQPAATALLRHLQSEQARAVMRRFGYVH